MKKIAVFCAACLAAIVLLLARLAWSDYERRREAEAALSQIETVRPPRFKVAETPGGVGAQDAAPQIVVSVEADGRIELNAEESGTTADTGPLRAKLEEILRGRADQLGRAVVVRAAREVRYAEVSKVVEAARAAGADHVSLEARDSK
jgi:biopolymer transport protein ExbD